MTLRDALQFLVSLFILSTHVSGAPTLWGPRSYGCTRVKQSVPPGRFHSVDSFIVLLLSLKYTLPPLLCDSPKARTVSSSA